MKKTIVLIIFFSLTSLFCFGQKDNKGIIDSIFIHSDSPSEFRIKFLGDCQNAIIIADQDIKNNEIKIFIVGGIAPAIFTTDKDFEKKYQVTYSDYGDLPASDECILNYNSTIFNYLTENFGKNWKKEIRKDVYGLKKWEKNKKNAT